jgi:formate dehydrogenase alpha subunit
MTNSMDDIATQARSYLIIGSNTTEQHPVLGMRIRQAVKRRETPLIVADPRRIPITEFATLHLQHKPGTDIALLNGLAHVLIAEDLIDREFIAARTENFEAVREAVARYTPEGVAEITGVPAEDIVRAARLLAANRPGALLYAMGITQHTTGTANVLACANLQMLLGNIGVPGGGVNPLRGQNNVQGACDMGALPNFYPGYQSVTVEANRHKFQDAWGTELPAGPGLTIVEIMRAALAGRVRGLYVMGENPVLTDPDSNHVRKCLEAVDLLVVQDIFLNETGTLADVVLPAVSFAEKDGTFTNTERRVQRVRQAIQPIGQARPDWQILAEVARRCLTQDDELHRCTQQAPCGRWDYRGPAEIMDEIAGLTPSYGGISHERLGGQGLQWPCPDKGHPGTPILHVGRFTRGLGRFTPVEYLPPAEVPDDGYPLTLTTGRMLFHYHTGTMTRRSKGLHMRVPSSVVEIHPEDAQRAGVRDGDAVRVRSRRGEVTTTAMVTEDVMPGVVFMTFHFAEAPANVLTNAALDPVAKIPEYKACAVAIERVDGRG